MLYVIFLLKFLVSVLVVGVAARLIYPRLLNFGWLGTFVLGLAGIIPAIGFLKLLGRGYSPFCVLGLLAGFSVSLLILFTRKFDAVTSGRGNNAPYWTYFYL